MLGKMKNVLIKIYNNNTFILFIKKKTNHITISKKLILFCSFHFLFFVLSCYVTKINRFSPTRAPSPWDGVKIADKFSPVCPQRPPNILNETAALEKMPKGRLEYLKRLLPFLQNQSEDCLYLNVFTPSHGMYID